MENQIELFVLGFKKWAKMNKVSQKKIAAAISKSQPTISDYFKLEYYPDIDLIQTWINRFDLNYNDIIETGRQIKNSTTYSIDLIDERVQLALAKQPHPTSLTDRRNQKFSEILSQFSDPDIIEEIYTGLAALNKINPVLINSVKSFIKVQIEENQKGVGKKTASGE